MTSSKEEFTAWLSNQFDYSWDGGDRRLASNTIRTLVADTNRDLCAALQENIELQEDMELFFLVTIMLVTLLT